MRLICAALLTLSIDSSALTGEFTGSVVGGDVILEELERRARASGLGLWADPHPVPPWEWRKRK